MTKKKTDYYVYALCDPRYDFNRDGLKNQPFYIGKGRYNRYKMHLKEAEGHRKPVNKYSRRSIYLREMRENNISPEVMFIKKELYEDDAFDLETHLIKRYGRKGIDQEGILTNRTCDQRTEHKAYSPKGIKRPPRTKIHIERQKASRAGFRNTEETKQKMSKSHLGKKQTAEHIAKRAANSIGAGNPNSLSWTIKMPNGEIHQVKGLRTWCREKNLRYYSVYGSRDGFSATKIGKGKGGRPQKNKMLEPLHPKIIGHCLIKNLDTGEILADKLNSINAEAMSYALALSIADRPNGNIAVMVFGNGASAISAVGTITYLPPNVTGLDAQLYNQTYQKFVDDLSPLDTDPTNNFIRVNHTLGNTYSDVVVTCLLDYNEPPGQQAFDDATDVTGDFIFDEIGLETYDPTTLSGFLLSHVIFHPVQKSLNRRIEIVYTLRIIMA